MLFSTTIFLFYFLPIVLIMYYISPKKIRNIILLIASLFFYAFGEPKFVVLMIISIIINYGIGILIDASKHKKTILVIGVTFNLLFLGYFKYYDFVISNINYIFGSDFTIKNIMLPIGISFFTFQSLSYLVDVYRQTAKVQKNLFNLSLYISFFPQLIAGPIVRYNTIEKQIKKRRVTQKLMYSGTRKFVYGLSKKLIVANQLALVADNAFALNKDGISMSYAWIGVMCYSLQIYFDFSGYSDMAIGLGRMFGFEFTENFNYPYISKSITEFWRRWHMSLGTWFRDYVYIPLGGNRKGKNRTIINTLIVWTLTGLWHGASYNFVLWGFYFGVIIILEKYVYSNWVNNGNKVLLHIYTIVLFLFGWVLFRAENLQTTWLYMQSMFDYKNMYDINTIRFLNVDLTIFVIGVIFSTPIVKYAKGKINENVLSIVEVVELSILLYLCTIYMISVDYNPFIYFNF